MPIFKIQNMESFAAIPNSTLRDKRLSIEARGTLAYLLTHSDTFELSLEFLQQELAVGRDKLRNIIRELKQNGYLMMVAAHSRDGTFNGQHWHVFAKSTGIDYCDEPLHRPPEKPTDGETVRRLNRQTENTEDNIKEKSSQKKRIKDLKEKKESLSARGRGENLPADEEETEIFENGMRGISAENLFGLPAEEAETKFTRIVIDGLKDRLKYPATLPKEFEWKKAVERAWKNKFSAGQCLDVFDLLEKITKLKGGHWGISPPYWEGNIGRVEALRRELEELEKREEQGSGKLQPGNRNGKFDRGSASGGGAPKPRRVDLSRFKGPDDA